MNNRYEEGRTPLFSESGEKFRKQYIWTKNAKGEKVLQETAPIDIQAEIESYADECDIKNIVRKASFDPEFLKSLQDSAGAEVDISNWPTNIHEYHQMMATAQVKAMELENLSKKMKANNAVEPEQNQENGKMHKKEEEK
nr:MAG TPA: Scaffold protein [Microviridae sp.]